MAVNMQQKFVMVLEARGFVIVKRGKYVVMEKETRHKVGKLIRLYVGRSGALRAGTSQALSRPLFDSTKQKLLAEYDNLMPPGF